MQEFDYFISGTAVSGGIGKLGWTLAGNGTPVATRNNASFSASVGSRLQVQTSAVIDDRACLLSGETENRTIMIRPDNINIIQACMDEHADQSPDFLRAVDNFALAPAPWRIARVFLRLSVSPNWQLVDSRRLCGVSVSDGNARLRLRLS